MFIITDKFNDYINYQVTTAVDNKEQYTKLSEIEYEVISQYIDPYPKRILELGCGLGRMSIFLNKKHPSNSKYHLADMSCITPTPTKSSRYGWDPGTWYNDLELTKEFCEINGLVNFEIIDLATGSITLLRDIDFIFSVMSVGFHYPIEQYMDILKLVAKPDALIIFGVRKGFYENKIFLNQFKSVEFKDMKEDSKERFLILKGWK